MSHRLNLPRCVRAALAAGLMSTAVLAAAPAPSFAQTADLFPAACDLAIPADLYNSDADVAASIAQTQSDCLAATTTPAS